MALQMTGFAMLLPLFARRFDSFGAGVEALGVSDMAYALSFAFAAPFIGMLADRFGRRASSCSRSRAMSWHSPDICSPPLLGC
jgi:MFS family permease